MAKTPKKPKESQEQKDINQLKTDIAAGKDIATNDLGLGGNFLGRLDENVDRTALDATLREYEAAGKDTPEAAAAVERLKQFADKAGITSADMQSIIDQRKGAVATAGNISAEQQQALAERKQRYTTAGITDPAIQRMIDERQTRYDNSGTWSADDTALLSEAKSRYANSQSINPLVQESIDRARSGLGGFTSPESQAYLETLTRGADKNLAGAMRTLGGNVAASGLRGGFGSAAASDIMKDYARTQMDARNQLAVANASLQDSRLGAFTNLANTTDQNLYSRGSQTFGDMGNLVSGLDSKYYGRSSEALNDLQGLTAADEANRYTRSSTALTDLEVLRNFLDKQSYDRTEAARKNLTDVVSGNDTNNFNQRFAADQAYNQATTAQQANNRTDTMNRLNAWRDELGKVQDASLKRSMTNLNTLASEVSARTGAILGVPQHLQAVRTGREANAIAREQIDAMKEAAAPAASAAPIIIQNGTGFNTPNTAPPQTTGVTNANQGPT